MSNARPIHPDFLFYLKEKEQSIVNLFLDLRAYLFELYPEGNELLYHTHALTAVFSISEKLGDAYCHIPVYTQHINLGFNKGALLEDPDHLLTGTGKLIRHIAIQVPVDYRNDQVRTLVKRAIEFAEKDMDKPTRSKGKTISKIKIK